MAGPVRRFHGRAMDFNANAAPYLKTRRVFTWAARYLGEEVAHSLRCEYTPVRCVGDALSHRMISLLANDTLSPEAHYAAANELYASLDDTQHELWGTCWKYIRHTLKALLDRGSTARARQRMV
jgi:hypothetical protein